MPAAIPQNIMDLYASVGEVSPQTLRRGGTPPDFVVAYEISRGRAEASRDLTPPPKCRKRKLVCIRFPAQNPLRETPRPKRVYEKQLL